MGNSRLPEERHRLGQMLGALVLAMGEPAGNAADNCDEHTSGQPLGQQKFQIRLFFPVDRSKHRLSRQSLQIVRQLLVKHRIEQGLERLVLSLIGASAGSVCRIFGEISLDLGPTLRRQCAINVGVQVIFSDIERAHRTTLRLAPIWRPSMIWRSRSRPRDRRDMTVPIGIPSVPAMSA